MSNIFLFLSIVFIVTLVVGRLIEKIRVPWFFSALLFGFVLAVYNPFYQVTSSDSFNFMAELGMYLLLFMIGLEINLSKLKERSSLIVRSAIVIIGMEAVVGTIVMKFAFNLEWLIAFIVAFSFATVGEAILLPILDELKLINTKLGQLIVGIGTIDDVVELLALVFVIILTGSAIYAKAWLEVVMMLFLLFLLFGLTFIINKFKNEGSKFKSWPIEILFLLSLFIFFFYLGIGEFVHALPVAALLAGVAIKTFLPPSRFQLIVSEIRSLSYGFFAPLFFVWVGLSLNIDYLLKYPLLILLVIFVSAGAKYLGTILSTRKTLGLGKSLLLGTGLCLRFSTSIIIIKILLDNALIDEKLYSVILASSAIFTFIIPLLFVFIINRLHIGTKDYDQAS